ncbi:Bax inhibitor-1/YccA family protein [Aquabacterium sp. A7-Y]|uniref:Bax inhibitor-1/YccA family protein n=1 Tax=Aquabacterium sp. A7-Y TaxID=1349605 RepID=UPI00223CFD7B|nr:Bax inhibitor-1/YccA family protein [Aquabacterium sp. A7-Y]MCW7540774.1 Bax inhibitor-1/YccA family protein [Aquabacterium sp. A7-Y]
MNESLRAYSGAGVLVEQRNRVLRNTYWLLALSMVPTVLGAWIGVQGGFSLFAGKPFIGFLVFMGVAFGFFFAIEKFKNSPVGVVLLLGFTFFMGLMLSRLIGAVLGNFSNGAQLIMMAFGGTAVVFFGMATLATTVKRDLTGMGKWLMVGAVMLIVAGVANIFLQMTALAATISALAVVIFSAFMLYDIKRVVDGGESNYITATLAIYLDLYNVFQSLLSLLGLFGGERD